MTGAWRAAHPRLRELLAGPMVGYDLRTDPRSVHFGLPSTTATVILAFEQPLDVGWAASPHRSEQGWFIVAGLHLEAALVRTHGRQFGLQLAVTPLGFRRLFGVPIAMTAHCVASATDLGVPRSLHDQIADAADWSARFDLMQSHLLARATGSTTMVASELAHAWRLLRQPNARVDAVATEVGWSRRQLQTRFRGEFGITPKQVARVARFDRCRRAVQGGLALAQAAAEFGYSDQAHLTRDWTRFAGRPPALSLAEDFPIVQDEPGVCRAD